MESLGMDAHPVGFAELVRERPVQRNLGRALGFVPGPSWSRGTPSDPEAWLPIPGRPASVDDIEVDSPRCRRATCCSTRLTKAGACSGGP